MVVWFKIGNDDSTFITNQYAPKVGDTHQDNSFMAADYWRHNIYHYNTQSDDEDKESRCAKRCLVSHDDQCNFYFWGNGYCQLGRFNSAGNAFQGTTDDSAIFQMKTSIGTYVNTFNIKIHH